MKCSICRNEINTEHGHNAEPINNGRCCEMCNQMIVIPKRYNDLIKSMERKD